MRGASPQMRRDSVVSPTISPIQPYRPDSMPAVVAVPYPRRTRNPAAHRSGKGPIASDKKKAEDEASEK
ncbi:hypothetical protein ACKVWM_006741 [Pyricularia oryzae]